MFRALSPLLLAVLAAPALAGDGNRLAYLDENTLYHVSRHFPRLTTPQWIGEDGVEAVVVLAIDDMRGPERWEAYLRPILRRLKQIDGRAPVSIMTCRIDPRHAHLQAWLREGLSLETHTFDHPCPLLQGGDLGKARTTYERCVDLLAEVPHSKPVAFRMPCCDSLNTPSPRFFAELFNRTTAKGNFLTLDSSVFNVLTAADPDLPRDLVLDPGGRDRFRKYLPEDRSFVNTVENYPYPYVIGRLCWEFPCVTPSDWQAQHLHKPAHPVTLRDWQAALDAIVHKQGVFTLVFHPYNWMRSEQVVALIDHAVARHGRKVKFLTFREAQERLNKNLLSGQPLRAADGGDNGVRLLDVDNDGFLDVVIGNDRVRQTRRWQPKTGTWAVTDFPVPIVTGDKADRQATGVQFGVVRPDGRASCLVRGEGVSGGWHFDGTRWQADSGLLAGLDLDGTPVHTARAGRDRGVRLRDLNGDGCCELIVGNDRRSGVFGWSAAKRAWQRLPFALPEGTAVVDEKGRDHGLRFVDVDEDGQLDVMSSNEDRYGLHLFASLAKGWSRRVLAGKHGDAGALPPIAKNGTDNGAWFHSGQLWVQNEHTALLKDHVDRRAFRDLLAGVDPGPKSPAAALASVKVPPGFRVELMAAEPLVQDPIAIAWGPDGKLWVVEMGDYPLGTDGKGRPGGRVKFLEDTDGDGRYDRATVFLDGLPFPTGVMPWRKGVLITCAPDILYAEDTDGDGKADRRDKVYTGFVEGNQQHRVNGLVWGLDNWIYCANGDSGGQVRSVKTGRVLDMRGRDLRLRPDDGGLEGATGQSQYGRNRDDWGDWFGGNNSNPLWHFVLADRYLRRNPHLAPPNLRVPVPTVPGAAPVFPRSRTLPRFNDLHAANRFTSACSPIIYRDDLYGPAFADNTFVSEPVHNLVHREVMRPSGFTFRSQRAAGEEHAEFLASSDNWFRPTMIRIGPDGCLWVADMYRAVIEHPQWIPADWQKRLDLRAGHDKGRIYRVVPVGTPPRAIPRLDRLDTAGLVAALDSPSGWQRDLAQQMLLWRKDARAVPLLARLATTAKRPQARLHALCTLDGLDALAAPVLRAGLADAHPGVRRHAVRLCEGRLKQVPAAGDVLFRLVDDLDAQVRLQLACTLGAWADPRAGQALGRLLARDGADPYLAAAVLSSVGRDNLDAVLLAVLRGGKAGYADPLLRMAAALGDERALTTLLQAVGRSERGQYAAWQLTALAGLLDALDQRGSSLARLAQGAKVKAAVAGLDGLFAAARKLATDAKAPVAERVRALGLLGRGPGDDRARLAGLLVPQTPEPVQEAAVAALGRTRDAQAAELLLRGWKGYGPALRVRVLDVLLQRDASLRVLLKAIEGKQVLPAEVDAAHRQRLVQHREARVRQRAEKLFAGASDPDRRKVVDAYLPALQGKADPARGRTLFARACATCHKLEGVGNEVGPDLAALSGKPADYLLTAILDPNRAVEARYVNYVAETKNGVALSGVLLEETGTSITLVGTDGKPRVVLRVDLESLTSTGKSAMPEGLEKDLKPQDVADLVAYVRSVRPSARKVFPGNRPEVVRPAADGALRLSAASAAVYGPSLVIEPRYGNLGYWTSPLDRAEWEVDLPAAGRYAVWLEYACAGDAAGNTFALEAGGRLLTGRVAGTGTWDVYRRARVGELILPAGRQRMLMRADGPLKGALIDLKAIRLVPAK